MDDKTIKLINALTDLNSALFVGLETALLVLDKWDIMPDKQKEDIISSLKLLVENNKSCFKEKPTLH